MEHLTLQEIANAVKGHLTQQCTKEVLSVSTDTRTIQPGCLYIAIEGERFDGHEFILDAFAAGAVAAISSKPIETKQPLILVENTKIAYGKLAAYYRSLFPVFVVGVTGSVGKTSTKEMIYTVMSEKYQVLKTQGNFNNDIGVPKTLLELCAQDTGAVIEMGMSALGEISYLSKLVKPDLGVITNIGVSHMEKLGSRENILKAKLEILDGMKPDAKLILNADNDKLIQMKDVLKERALYFGIEQPADVTAKEIRQVEDGTEFMICYQQKEYPAVLPVIGIHNVYNALSGFLVGIEIGLTPNQIIKSYLNYQNSGMRQRVREYNGIKVIEDCYNASPDSMQAAIGVIGSISCSGRRIAVLGDMLELGEQSAKMHHQVGEMAAKAGLDEILCYGTEALHIFEGAKQANYGKCFHFLNRENMVSYIKELIQPGDAIIFKASRGMKLEQVIEQLFPKNR